jgi:hypothetical protein
MDCQSKSTRLKKTLCKVMEKIDKFSKMSNISKKSISHIIRVFHFSIPFYLIFLIAYGPKILVIFSIFFLIIIYSGFLILKGCLLSSIEAKMFNDNFFITDPALELCRMELTTKNRFKISYIVGSIYLLIVILIIYLRFFRKKKI